MAGTGPARPTLPPGVPVAGTLVALDPAHYATLRRTVGLLFQIAHSPAYQAWVDRDAVRETDRFDPGNHGVMMGYDFHLTPDGPRLIEINTNAGGALLNGLHTLSLVDPERLACLCADLLPVSEIEVRIVATFRAEMEAARGPGAGLRRVAIVDEAPERQFLAPEMELFRDLFARHGIEAHVADTSRLEALPGGGVALGGAPLDLVYLRDTDFALETARTRVLRDAYLARRVVVTPSPREHFLLADKRRLAIFSSPKTLQRLGVPAADAQLLARVVPETRLLSSLSLEEAWRTRARWVFKPAAGFGSRAVYRGDKLTRRKLEEIAAAPGYVVQERVAPGEVEVETPEGRRAMKFDVRAYAYRDEVLLLGARSYQGQVTNLRTPGGGFTAICAVRADAGAPSLDAG